MEQVERYVSEGIYFRQDWEEVKVEIMRDIVHEKFGQSDHCRKVLLSTTGYFLEEASPHDSFWGIGKFGNGTNVLGKVLEEERETLLLNEVCA